MIRLLSQSPDVLSDKKQKKWKYTCSVCGCPIVKFQPCHSEKVLCDFHTRLLYLMIEGFESILGRDNYNISDYDKFFSESLTVLTKRFVRNFNKRRTNKVPFDFDPESEVGD